MRGVWNECFRASYLIRLALAVLTSHDVLVVHSNELDLSTRHLLCAHLQAVFILIVHSFERSGYLNLNKSYLTNVDTEFGGGKPLILQEAKR